MKINETLGSVTSVMKAVIGFGMSLMLVFLMVDVLFPNTTNIVGNVAGLVNSFMSHGLVGLIALLVFLSIYDRS